MALTKELTETLRKSRTVDWQRKESARAKMRTIIKKLLKKYKYPPEGQEAALNTVITQCELWTDNEEMFAELAENAVAGIAANNAAAAADNQLYFAPGDSAASYGIAAEPQKPYNAD